MSHPNGHNPAATEGEAYHQAGDVEIKQFRIALLNFRNLLIVKKKRKYLQLVEGHLSNYKWWEQRLCLIWAVARGGIRKGQGDQELENKVQLICQWFSATFCFLLSAGIPVYRKKINKIKILIIFDVLIGWGAAEGGARPGHQSCKIRRWVHVYI